MLAIQIVSHSVKTYAWAIMSAEPKYLFRKGLIVRDITLESLWEEIEHEKQWLHSGEIRIQSQRGVHLSVINCVLQWEKGGREERGRGIVITRKVIRIATRVATRVVTGVVTRVVATRASLARWRSWKRIYLPRQCRWRLPRITKINRHQRSHSPDILNPCRV